MKRFNLAVVICFLSQGLVFAEEATKIDWSQVLHNLSTGVLDVLVPVIAALVGIIAKKGFDLIKIKLIRTWVRKWVLSAYQKYTTGEHVKKFDEVAKKIHRKYPALSEEDIKDYIEEAVKGIKIELGRND